MQGWQHAAGCSAAVAWPRPQLPPVRLSKTNTRHTGRPDDDDGADERLNADLTAELHFGGGFIRKDTPTAVPGNHFEGAEPERRRSKKEARSRSDALVVDALASTLVKRLRTLGICEACGVTACVMYS
jgi:hypothetical protein